MFDNINPNRQCNQCTAATTVLYFNAITSLKGAVTLEFNVITDNIIFKVHQCLLVSFITTLQNKCYSKFIHVINILSTLPLMYWKLNYAILQIFMNNSENKNLSDLKAINLSFTWWCINACITQFPELLHINYNHYINCLKYKRSLWS